MKTAYLGIDPGITGAAALWTENNNLGIHDFKSPAVAAQVIQEWNTRFKILYCVLEDAPFISKGKFGLGKLNRNMGQWEGILIAFGVCYRTVAPAVWKKAIPPFISGDIKQRSINHAVCTIPGAEKLICQKQHHNRAEALLLAAYAKRIYEVDKMRTQ